METIETRPVREPREWERYALSCASALLLLFVFWLIRTGRLQDALALLPHNLQLGMYRTFLFFDPRTLPVYPELVVMARWSFVFMTATLVFCQVCVQVLLFRPVRGATLLDFARAIFFFNVFAVSFVLLYGLNVFPDPRLRFVEVTLAIFSLAASCRYFLWAFASFPLPFDPALFKRARREYPAQKAWRRVRPFLLRHPRVRTLAAWNVRISRRLRMNRTLKSGTILKLWNLTQSRYFAWLLAALMLIGWLNSFTLASTFVLGLSRVTLFILVMVVILNCEQKLLVDYRFAPPSVRRQISWLWFGVMTIVMLPLITYFLPALLAFYLRELLVYIMPAFLYFHPTLAVLVFVSTLMISIYFYGAIDPERVIKSALLYSLLGLLLTLFFVVLDQVGTPLLVALTGLPGRYGTLLSGFIIAAVSTSVRRYIESRLTRIMDKVFSQPPNMLS